MEMKVIKSRLRTVGRMSIIGAAGVGLTMIAGSPAGAAPTTAASPCKIFHELYQQPVATMVADASGETCVTPAHPEGRQVLLLVYRNGVQIDSESGGIAPHFEYQCTTTATTTWSTNWDPPKDFPCG